jgi:thiamine-phosphate pyrophosphorylase
VKLPKSPLHAICDADACDRAGWTLPDFVSACLRGGAQVLQVRAKFASSRWLYETVLAAVEVARPAGAVVLVNDRADIARLTSADGVHIGQEDLSPAQVRSVVGEEAIVGLSTHTLDQIDAAVRAPVSYIAVGPIFGTATKATGYDAVGLDRVRAASGRAAASRLPVVAIGGITLERAPSVIQAGAQSVAVISDLLATGSPEDRVREYLAALDRL